MGKIYLDKDNKLVIQTDNGQINPDGTQTASVNENEEYTVNPMDVLKLMAIVNQSDIRICEKYAEGYEYSILTDKDKADIINKCRGDIEFWQKKYREADGELDRYKLSVEDFNEKRRLFWRPVKIKKSLWD